MFGSSSVAGVYNFAEERDPLFEKPRNPEEFRAYILTLRDIGVVARTRLSPFDPTAKVKGRDVEWERPILQRHLLMMYLDTRGKWDLLPPEQLLDLSGYLLRCRQEKTARTLLDKRAAKDHSEQFLLLANLAAAYFLMADLNFLESSRYRGADERLAIRALDEGAENLRTAISWQQRTLKAWPVDFAALTPAQAALLAKGAWNQAEHDLYRNREEYFLKLMEERLEEIRDRKEYEVATVDPLFKDDAGKPIRFVNDDGAFEPGKLAKAERDKLPKNAEDIVKQLLLWTPTDDRLMWLWGELLCSEGGSDSLKVAKNVFVKDIALPAKDFKARQAYMKTFEPPEPRVSIDDIEKKLDDMDKAANPPYPWRDIVLSFIFGMGVAFFAYWQFREIRRRHQRNS